MTDAIDVIDEMTDGRTTDFGFAADGSSGGAGSFVDAYQVFTRVVNRLQSKLRRRGHHSY